MTPEELAARRERLVAALCLGEVPVMKELADGLYEVRACGVRLLKIRLCAERDKIWWHSMMRMAPRVPLGGKFNSWRYQLTHVLCSLDLGYLAARPRDRSGHETPFNRWLRAVNAWFPANLRTPP